MKKNVSAEFAQSKSIFLSSAFSMGWRLALAVMIPILIGVNLDQYTNSSPLYTILGFSLGITGGCLVMYKTLKDLGPKE